MVKHEFAFSTPLHFNLALEYVERLKAQERASTVRHNEGALWISFTTATDLSKQEIQVLKSFAPRGHSYNQEEAIQ